MNERWHSWETSYLLRGNLEFKQPDTIIERPAISKGNWQ